MRKLSMLQGYQRPKITHNAYTDDSGAPIGYGQRWDDQPPAETYSVTAHPQRFSPVQVVAEALVEWICEFYKVRCFEDPGLAAQLRVPSDELVRSVRLFPEDSRCAPMGLVFTRFPGVQLRFGALFQAAMPHCGCDACDESVPDLLDELEAQVGAVLSGSFVEVLDLGNGRMTHQFNVEELGSCQQSTGLDEISPAQLAWARAVIPVDGAWAPWPAR